MPSSSKQDWHLVEGGLAVVILAVILDRITQSFGKGNSGGVLGFFKRLSFMKKTAGEQSSSALRKQEV